MKKLLIAAIVTIAVASPIVLAYNPNWADQPRKPDGTWTTAS